MDRARVGVRIRVRASLSALPGINNINCWQHAGQSEAFQHHNSIRFPNSCQVIASPSNQLAGFDRAYSVTVGTIKMRGLYTDHLSRQSLSGTPPSSRRDRMPFRTDIKMSYDDDCPSFLVVPQHHSRSRPLPTRPDATMYNQASSVQLLYCRSCGENCDSVHTETIARCRPPCSTERCARPLLCPLQVV